MSSTTTAAPKDHWDSETYSQKVAPYVPALTTKVVALLDPQANDHILDLGCGDGVLTSQLSTRVSSILGIDSSANMISSALTNYSTPTTTYLTVDGASLVHPITQASLLTHLPPSAPKFTKLFSNAALHWILRAFTPTSSGDLSRLIEWFRGCHALLAPGGTFVSESGGQGNVAEVHAALVSALLRRGIPPAEARAASPWLFPSPGLMRKVMQDAGFVVEVCELEARPTEMVGGDVESWVRLFGQAFLDAVEEWCGKEDGEVGRREREEVVKEVVEVVEAVGRRVEDGAFVLGYVRLRVKATKPAE